VLSAASGAAFGVWSTVVRYSVAAAIFVLVTGAVAVAFMGSRQPASASGGQTRRARAEIAIPLLLAAIVTGLAWAFYALAWLVVGPEGRASCNCWADYYNDWQYQVQLFVALGGALSLVAAAALYVVRRRAAFGVTGAIAASALCGWIAFLVTGSG
jgi:hypothetical protein